MTTQEKVMSMLIYAQQELNKQAPNLADQYFYHFEIHLTDETIEKLKSDCFSEITTEGLRFAGQKIIPDTEEYIAVIKKYPL